MKRIRIINIIPEFPYQRQLPAKFSEERGCRFFFGPGDEEYDYLVCYDKLKIPLQTSVPRERRILLIGEPRCITRYPASYLNLFGVVVCPYDLPKYQGIQLHTSPALWWFYGFNPKDYAGSPIWSFDEIAAQPVPAKTGLLSTVCSNKSYCMRHGRRRAFVIRLQQYFQERMTSFGPGFQPAPDKKEAIDPYKYHIVIENNDDPKFWTEKLADAFLGYSFPFYIGGDNVEQDFPEGSFLRLDIRQFKKSVRIIEDAMRRDLWEQRLDRIIAAREKILHEYNTFKRILNIVGIMPGPDVVPGLPEVERLPVFNETRQPYHFREHLNHMAIKHLPLTGPIFKF